MHFHRYTVSSKLMPFFISLFLLSLHLSFLALCSSYMTFITRKSAPPWYLLPHQAIHCTMSAPTPNMPGHMTHATLVFCLSLRFSDVTSAMTLNCIHPHRCTTPTYDSSFAMPSHGSTMRAYYHWRICPFLFVPLQILSPQ